LYDPCIVFLHHHCISRLTLWSPFDVSHTLWYSNPRPVMCYRLFPRPARPFRNPQSSSQLIYYRSTFFSLRFMEIPRRFEPSMGQLLPERFCLLSVLRSSHNSALYYRTDGYPRIEEENFQYCVLIIGSISSLITRYPENLSNGPMGTLEVSADIHTKRWFTS
jgi:hypothetical protein